LIKRISIFSLIILLCASIYHDLSKETVDSSHLQQTMEASSNDFSAVKVNVTTGDTALTIIEDINQHMEHLNVDQVIADFHTLNPNTNPYRLEEDTSYYFPLYDY